MNNAIHAAYRLNFMLIHMPQVLIMCVNKEVRYSSKAKAKQTSKLL